MPVSTTSTDYTGRLIDVNISGRVDLTDPSARPMGLTFGLVSSKCTGVLKLCQKYTVVLLTAIGSQPEYQTFGTDLIPTLLGGNMINVGELVHTFNLASWSAVKQLKAYQAEHPEIPVDERISTAMLESYDVQGTTVLFNVKLITEAGVDVPFVLPVGTLI